MKKYINIKKFMQDHVKNMHLAAVAVVGLGIAVFCSAYSVPEGCTPSVTVSPDLEGNCSEAEVSASCVGDDASDTVNANDNGGSGVNLGNVSDSGEACDSTGWGTGEPDPSPNMTLVTGLNKITAVSSELGITSPEVDITIKSANGPTVTITSSWSSSLPVPPAILPCGLLVVFNFNCFTPNELYWWGEDVTASGSCPSCANVTGGGGPFTTDGSGNAAIADSSQIPCPSPTATTCTCSDVQKWHVDDLGNHNPQQNNIVTGTTTRVKHTAPNVSTVTLTSS